MYSTVASGWQDCSILGECLVPSLFQGMNKKLPQSAYGESIIPIYVTVQLDLYLLPYKPVHAHPPRSDCHPAHAGSKFFPTPPKKFTTEWGGGKRERERREGEKQQPS
jgi:hypothetical protein